MPELYDAGTLRGLIPSEAALLRQARVDREPEVKHEERAV
jgi:hypothetical protein